MSGWNVFRIDAPTLLNTISELSSAIGMLEGMGRSELTVNLVECLGQLMEEMNSQLRSTEPAPSKKGETTDG